jgi:hypothetical protein
MTTPSRIQLSPRKGFDLQAASRTLNGLPAVSVARSTIFGNPCSCKRPFGCPHHPDFERWAWADDDGAIDPLLCCVDVYRHYVETGLAGEPTRTGHLLIAFEGSIGYPRRVRLVAALPRLRGKNLACWCALTDRCHADVLLEIANR